MLRPSAIELVETRTLGWNTLDAADAVQRPPGVCTWHTGLQQMEAGLSSPQLSAQKTAVNLSEVGKALKLLSMKTCRLACSHEVRVTSGVLVTLSQRRRTCKLSLLRTQGLWPDAIRWGTCQCESQPNGFLKPGASAYQARAGHRVCRAGSIGSAS